MHFVLNAINGEYLRDITLNAANDTERVDAAVAYVSREDLLFEWCWTSGIPLQFWGRFDENVPVTPKILRRFLDRKSAAYTCKLVRKFHSKVIWWHGVGAYVGSANLSDSAWYKNVEAGTFYEEAELTALGLDQQLRAFFTLLDEQGSPLTEELCSSIEHRAKQLSKIRDADAKDAADFLANPNVKPWEGLVQVSRKAASVRQREAFLFEWNDTLTILRNLAAKVELHRPRWVSETAPSGAHVDQFLHAHYYNRVMQGGRSYYEQWYDQNSGNADEAERQALRWWQELPTPPSHEDRMLNDWAPYLKDRLSAANLIDRSEESLFQIFRRVHSIADHARRIPNKLVGLPGGRQYSMDEKTRALATRIRQARSDAGADVFEVLHHVLHGGPASEVPTRLWSGLSDPKWKIDHIGRSALGEIVGWALPEVFPPRNSRTSKALRSLGHNVAV